MSDELIYANVQSEFLLVGALYKQPDTYLIYGESIRSAYDFSDDATKFFYNLFETVKSDLLKYKVLLFIITLLVFPGFF